MDGAWSAVDADGQVGCFSTGEAGGMPSGCQLDQGEAYDLLEALRASLPPCEPVFDPDGRLPGQERHWVHGQRALVFLDSLAPIGAELASQGDPGELGALRALAWASKLSEAAAPAHARCAVAEALVAVGPAGLEPLRAALIAALLAR